MNRRQDSRLISEMKEQLKRLQERRQELESRQVGEEDDALRQPIVPHLTRIMRDRQWAHIQSMVQRNMEVIDRDIQEAIGRLGAAMLDEPGSDPVSPRRSQRHYPDLIASNRQPEQQPRLLPAPASPSRQLLLETVRETLEKRKKPVNAQVTTGHETPSPRVALYQFRHQDQTDKLLSRLSVQQLPSVTIATSSSDRRSNNQIIDIQSPSVVVVPDAAAVAQAEPEEIQPDDVARLVSDLLASQIELAVDSLNLSQEPQVTSSRQPHQRNETDDKFLLTIDTCTQTAVPDVKDSSTTMAEKWMRQVDRSVGPDRPVSSPESDPYSEIIEEDEDDEESSSTVESLTPPRASVNIIPDPTPPLDLDLWRRRYPTTPPSSSSPCSECSMRPAEVTVILESSSSTTGPASSSSDATGISSSFQATVSSSSCTSTVDNAAVSWLSDGEVPNRVASPGQVTIHPTRTSTTTESMDRSDDVTFSEGQIPQMIRIPSATQLVSSLADGSSEGEILLPQPTSRSDSTASFRSATGSLGEIPAEATATSDEFYSE